MNIRQMKQTISLAILMFSILALSLNIYGLFKPLRYPFISEIPQDKLRFKKNNVFSYTKSLKQLEFMEDISDDKVYLKHATHLISQAIVHIDWFKMDAKKSYQLVPIWENYILHFMGRLSNLHYYERYHFISYKKSIERGYGVCGDAAMILSQLLDSRKIEHNIIAFEPHVVVEAHINGSTYIADPDFGVIMEGNLSYLRKNPQIIHDTYEKAGYREKDVRTIFEAINQNYESYPSVFYFLPKRYIFEHLSYILKWCFPAIGILFYVIYFMKFRFR
jgi:hypothetical protein